VAGSSTDANREYYVYGLVNPVELQRTRSDVLSIFYVGKGTGDRANQHERDVLRDLRKELLTYDRHSAKEARIRTILDSGGRIEAVELAHGFECSRDAERAESLAMNLMGHLLERTDRAPLTNDAVGRDSGFRRLTELRSLSDVDLPVEIVSGEPSGRAVSAMPTDRGSGVAGTTVRTLIVKGTTEPLTRPGQQVVRPAPPSRPAVREIVTDENSSDSFTRRGWDPLDPWSSDEAAERAARYWPFARSRVQEWVDEPSQAPTQLLLGVPGPNGRTTIRYAWKIDVDGVWDFYPESNRWGVPLGDPIPDHPARGRTLTEVRDGRQVQILLNYSSGCRVVDLKPFVT